MRYNNVSKRKVFRTEMIRWLTPHAFNILRLLHKQEKGEKLSVTEYSIFGQIVQDYSDAFGETPADFIEAVNSMERLLQGDK